MMALELNMIKGSTFQYSSRSKMRGQITAAALAAAEPNPTPALLMKEKKHY